MEQQPKRSIANFFWGEKSNIWFLLLIAIITLFAMLGAKELWTQEWRWVNISHQMMLRHAFFHPYLIGHAYYDKPLLTYWLIVGLSFLFKGLNLWAARLPSAIAGLIAIFCTYELGKTLSSRRTGMIAGWMLVSTFYFIFWARVGNADMLNIAGIMLAVLWYIKRRNIPNFLSYFVFFMILAVTSLLKGLIAPAVTIVVLIPDLLYRKNWKKHLKLSLIFTLILAIIVYLYPFIFSAYFKTYHYGESGLVEVFRENILRYIKPFDHQQPWYIYFKYLPLATAPWILFTIPALIFFPTRWHKISVGSRWMFWAFVLVFAFFTLSGSRRNYYILPMIPFALLFTADWLSEQAEKNNKINKIAGYCTAIFTALTLIAFAIIIPFSYSGGGPNILAKRVKQQAEKIQPWNKWHVQILATNNNMTYYLRSSNFIVAKKASPATSKKPTKENLAKDFPILTANNPNMIIVIGKNYLPIAKKMLTNYFMIQALPTLGNKLLHNMPYDAPVVFIPKFRTKGNRN